MAGNGKEAAEGFQGLAATTAAYLQAADDLVRYNEGRIRVQDTKKLHHSSRPRMVVSLVGIITFFVGVWLSRMITRSITIPIFRSAAQIDLMAKGDFSIPVSEHALKRKDEMGVFARSMEVMNSSLKQMLKEVTASAANVASASTQLTMSAGKLSKGATEQVERATVAATGSDRDESGLGRHPGTSPVGASATEAVNVAEEGRQVGRSPSGSEPDSGDGGNGSRIRAEVGESLQDRRHCHGHKRYRRPDQSPRPERGD